MGETICQQAFGAEWAVCEVVYQRAFGVKVGLAPSLRTKWGWASLALNEGDEQWSLPSISDAFSYSSMRSFLFGSHGWCQPS